MEARSHKIKKTRNTKDGERNHICGCGKAYKSYPALYLHIQRKHDSQKPENTISVETVAKKKPDNTHTGRPRAPENDIDNISENEEHLEQTQNQLMEFLGIELGAVFGMQTKPELSTVHKNLITGLDKKDKDKEMSTFYDRTLHDIVKSRQDEDIFLEDFLIQPRDSKDVNQVLSATLLWLGRYIVKPEFLVDIAILFYKMKEFVEDQGTKFGSELGCKMLEVKENVQKLSTKLNKYLQKDWKSHISDGISKFNSFFDTLMNR